MLAPQFSLLFFSLVFFFNQFVYQKVSMEMQTRSARNGKMSTIKASIYYTSEGKMASHYTVPAEILILNNTKGEFTVYDFVNNTVAQKQNYLLSSETNQLFYFLENNRGDLGLSKMGFALKETKFQDGLRITVWHPPMQLAKDISKVEVAHDKNNPVFLGYFNKKGKAINKVFFYNYEWVAGLKFPTSVTQISLINAKDSIVSKTMYSNFKTDKEVDDHFLTFKIPANAKVIE